jgi:hypothetical protein
MGTNRGRTGRSIFLRVGVWEIRRGVSLTVERLTTLPGRELENPYAHSRDCGRSGVGGGRGASVVRAILPKKKSEGG